MPPGLGLPSSLLGHYGGHRGADPGELDVARVFTSKVFEDIYCQWGIVYRISTAYNPRANKRAELAVTLEHDSYLINLDGSHEDDLSSPKLLQALGVSPANTCHTSQYGPHQLQSRHLHFPFSIIFPALYPQSKMFST